MQKITELNKYCVKFNIVSAFNYLVLHKGTCHVRCDRVEVHPQFKVFSYNAESMDLSCSSLL